MDFAQTLNSNDGGHNPPCIRRIAAALAKRSAGDQMMLDVESVVVGGVGGEKSLR